MGVVYLFRQGLPELDPPRVTMSTRGGNTLAYAHILFTLTSAQATARGVHVSECSYAQLTCLHCLFAYAGSRAVQQ